MNTSADVSGKKDGFVLTFIKGLLIGIANIIPGVSGGTFALILGVFHRLINALNGLSFETVKSFLSPVVKLFRKNSDNTFLNEWRRTDASFLIVLALGAFASILSTSFLIDFLLREHHAPTLAFFVGLILPSIAIPWAMMKRHDIVVLWAIPGIILTAGVSLIMPDGSAGSDNLLVALAVGAVSVSAMILPGLSGSYILLVMGQYQNVISKIIAVQRGLASGNPEINVIIWLVTLVIGIVAGIIIFAKFLSYLLKTFPNATMMFLIGLLIGSLWILWPFKNMDTGASIKDKSGNVKQEIRIATASNRMPVSTAEALPAGAAFFAGLIGSSGMIILGKRMDNSGKSSNKNI
ncbi:MAG: DUF368 domain-containing protein [Spirochaetes bacterium]|nr:DUF368 domain-containing protein [Spirochaetota bacterium]